MDAMDYEHFVRRVYQCSRYGVLPADADIYRRFERAEISYKLDLENIQHKRMRISTKPIEQLKSEFETESIRMWDTVKYTVKKAIKDYQYTLSQEEVDELLSLTTASPAIKSDIENGIRVTNKILAKHQIFPK